MNNCETRTQFEKNVLANKSTKYAHISDKNDTKVSLTLCTLHANFFFFESAAAVGQGLPVSLVGLTFSDLLIPHVPSPTWHVPSRAWTHGCNVVKSYEMTTIPRGNLCLRKPLNCSGCRGKRKMNLSHGWLKVSSMMKEAYRFPACAFRVPVSNFIVTSKPRQKTMKYGEILLSEVLMWKTDILKQGSKYRQTVRKKIKK